MGGRGQTGYTEGVSSLVQSIREANLISEEDLAALEKWPPYQGLRLAERLYRSGLVSDAKLCEIFVRLGATDGTADLLAGQPPPAALGALSRSLAERRRAIGLRIEKGRLVVAMLDPADTEAIEKISFFAGLAVEPRAVRPRVLFQALHEAYGIAPVLPDAAFLASLSPTGPFVEPPHSDGDGDTLPAPSPDIAPRVFGFEPRRLSHADPSSPLARSVRLASGEVVDEAPKSALAIELLRDVAPARTPIVDEAALAALRRHLPPGSALEARDSLPPQVLRLLVPPLRTAVLFLVRGHVAVGWDGRAPERGRQDIRDVLLPLTAPSTFQRALEWHRVALGNAADPTTIERILWRHLGLPAPSSLAVLPILVGDVVHALLYIDRAEGMLDDAHVDAARRAGNALADGIAPFASAGALFPEVTSQRLKPIPSQPSGAPEPAEPAESSEPSAEPSAERSSAASGPSGPAEPTEPATSA